MASSHMCCSALLLAALLAAHLPSLTSANWQAPGIHKGRKLTQGIPGLFPPPPASPPLDNSTAAAPASPPASSITKKQWPTASTQFPVSGTIQVINEFNGNLLQASWVGAPGNSTIPIFNITNSILKNVILASPSVGGIHCHGTVTLENVWWEDVGSSAATFMTGGPDDVVTVIGGGARNADGPVFRHLSQGKLIVRDFEAEDFDTLVQAEGAENRSTVIESTTALHGTALAGIVIEGSTAEVKGVELEDVKNICQKFRASSGNAQSGIVGVGNGDGCTYDGTQISAYGSIPAPDGAPVSAESKEKTWPTPSGVVAVQQTIMVEELLDGSMMRFTYGTGMNAEEPLIKVDNATLRNVIIGSPGKGTIVCVTSCTLENVWWEEVGEAAATMSDGNGQFLVEGGGSRMASGVVFQHHGAGQLLVRSHHVMDFHTLAATCPACGPRSANADQRLINVIDVLAERGKALVGVVPARQDASQIGDVFVRDVTEICVGVGGASGIDVGRSCRFDSSQLAFTGTIPNPDGPGPAAGTPPAGGAGLPQGPLLPPPAPPVAPPPPVGPGLTPPSAPTPSAPAPGVPAPPPAATAPGPGVPGPSAPPTPPPTNPGSPPGGSPPGGVSLLDAFQSNVAGASDGKSKSVEEKDKDKKN